MARSKCNKLLMAEGYALQCVDDAMNKQAGVNTLRS